MAMFYCETCGHGAGNILVLKKQKKKKKVSTLMGNGYKTIWPCGHWHN